MEMDKLNDVGKFLMSLADEVMLDCTNNAIGAMMLLILFYQVNGYIEDRNLSMARMGCNTVNEVKELEMIFKRFLVEKEEGKYGLDLDCIQYIKPINFND